MSIAESPRPATTSPRPRRPRRRWVRAVLREPLAAVSVLVLVLMAVVAIVAPWLVGTDPDVTSDQRLAGPSNAHPFGTDELGRDLFSRTLIASRTTLSAPVIAVGIALVVGVPLGMLGGYFRGWVDAILSRVADALMSVPSLVVAIAVIAALGTSMTNAMIGIGVVFAPRMFRVVRAATLSVREEVFIEGQQVIGASTRRIIFVNILPNISSPVIVQASLMSGFALVAEASLSFVGLGVQPPDASWGLMLRRATSYLHDSANLYLLLPGVLIVVIVLAFNILGDWLRDTTGGSREIR
ncbi:ABC transporter permease [Actinophytocola sp.]|uniref:ABC transporter permease n=1 Tax=Actinophytocola sp. TaxID=1872138 RepID=UPI003D6BCBAD